MSRSSLNLFNSRRLLLHEPLYQPPSPPCLWATASQPAGVPSLPGNRFDANVVMILAVLLCALICALGLNSIVRCALRCSNRVSTDAMTDEADTVAQHSAWMRRKALRSLPSLVYFDGIKLPGVGGMECPICLSDFADGERVRVLPGCSHGFHVRCIDRWLLARPSCPTCRRCLFSPAHKLSAQVAVILPLEPEPEGMVANSI